MDTDIDDLYDTDIPTSKSQNVLQLSDDNATTSTTIMNKFSITIATGTLRKHLDSQHPAQKTKLHMLVAEWIVSDTLSFSIVSSESFATMLRYLNANITFFKIAVTLDIWTSHANVLFLCITAHCIDNEWKLNKILLDICMLSHPHTGEEIDTQLHFVFAAFNITNKIFCATIDGASNMISAMQLLKRNLILQNDLFHIQPHHCLAHILNLIVMSGLSPIKLSIEKVYKLVNAISALSSLSQELNELGQSVGEGKTTRKIPQDVSTQWNSTYLMLSVYITMSTTIAALIRCNKNLNKYKLTLQEESNL
ncbi:14817_t:CDS:2 [Cetraspora pellucida]|uniref:14817_t:CDS:1 n=1 Tax=Cetraspora pellucida TaxID=1433469 RepID=A0ACA9M864_9GLOM|nr:14817_t:CDS:2 [Cetraspora pellucida]